MAATGGRIQTQSVAIAPAPSRESASHLDSTAGLPRPVMPYTCQTCAKRKVKCDKTTPVCSTCLKSKIECIYQEPVPRRRKRKPSDALSEKLAQYERILHQHGLLPQEDANPPPAAQIASTKSKPFEWKGHNISTPGKLLTGEGKSRYIESNIWEDLGEDEIHDVSDEEAEHQVVTTASGGILTSDPLTEAFLGRQEDVAQYYPTHAHAMILWEAHVENVEPIYKILHIPSTASMFDTALQHPGTMSTASACLFFAVCHFAAFSMSEGECVQRLSQSRAPLLQVYHSAARHALVKASFLKTTEMPVLQALVLLLLASRYFYDAQTYWILTGVAVRIAQRMGIHRDGEKLGLPPFEVQMRRRLFYQILPLDGTASQMSGNSIGIVPDAWDTREPLNINDDQIWPGMTDAPEEKIGATQMIFPLARLCIGKCYLRAGKWTHGAVSPQTKDYEDAESIINEAENEVEQSFIRYCDVINPLHFLTMASARTGIIAMRLRTRLLKVKNQTATDAERRQVFHFAQKIIDADTTTCTHTGLKRFQWHMRPFFLWGTWDALIYVMTTLWKSDLITGTGADEAWGRLEQVYDNHAEVLESRRALYTAFGHLTLKAWDTNPPSDRVTEPGYITMLRSRQKGKGKGRGNGECANTAPSPDGVSPAISGLFTATDIDTGSDISLDAADWAFWEQLIQESQQQGEFGQ